MTIKNKFPPKKPDNSHIIKAPIKREWSEYQKDIFRDIARGTQNTLIIARAGSAKCLGKGTQILCYDGSIKKVEDIITGDLLMGPDSKPRQVLNINTGYGNMVKINPIKGDSWICNDDHILTLIKNNHRKDKIIDISVKDFIKKTDNTWKIIRTGVEFENKILPFDPYLIGLWIGNATKSKADATSNTKFRMGANSFFNTGTVHYLLKRFLLNECVKNNEKYIPNDYLINSRENRLKLLTGIIDINDGNNGHNSICINSTIKPLADQYAFLARSLGFAAYITKCNAKDKSIYWSVNLSGDLSQIPILLEKKKNQKRKQIKNHLYTEFKIENLGKGDYYGFTLDGDGRFLLSDFTITHNTSSLVEGSKYIPKGKKSLFCAFNKSIQEELKNKLPSYIDCSTLHSLGFRGIKQRFGNVELDNYKCQKIVEDIIGKSKDNYDLNESICKTVSLCKATLTDVPSKIEELITEYDIDLCEIKIEVFVKYVSQTLRLCKEKTSVIDFDDMIYFPFVYHINVGKHDYVFIDESQDMNRCQIELALSTTKLDGRIIAVLDPRQAIYSWRGADTKVLDNLRSRLKNPKELLLPICYRCPQKIVRLAQSIVPDILPYEKSAEGEIIDIMISDLQKYAKPGSYVLSRVNAPLVKYCMQFLKRNIPSNILGRDIGNNLSHLIKKSKKKKVIDLIKWLEKWEKEEKEKLLEKYPNANTEIISDKAECIRMLCEDTSTLEEVQENIDNLFKDGEEKNIVLFSSIHRIKGKETDNVFVLENTLRNGSEEEENIRYVAYTRAKKNLYLVRSPGKYSKYDNKISEKSIKELLNS